KRSMKRSSTFGTPKYFMAVSPSNTQICCAAFLLSAPPASTSPVSVMREPGAVVGEVIVDAPCPPARRTLVGTLKSERTLPRSLIEPLILPAENFSSAYFQRASWSSRAATPPRRAQNTVTKASASASVCSVFHCAASSFVIRNCTGPSPHFAFSGDNAASALPANARSATNTNRLRVFIRFSPGLGSRGSECPSPPRLFLFEVLDLVVQLVHLLLDLLLLEHPFAHQQAGQAVEEDVVLDDHLLELLVLVLGAVVLVDVVHAVLLVARKGVSQQMAKWRRGAPWLGPDPAD